MNYVMCCVTLGGLFESKILHPGLIELKKLELVEIYIFKYNVT